MNHPSASEWCLHGKARSEQSNDSLQARAVRVVECSEIVRIQVKNRSQLTSAVQHWYDNLRPRARIAGNVTWKSMHIVNDLGLLRARSCSTDSAVESDLQTSDWTLVGSDPHEVLVHDPIETGPARPADVLMQDAGHASHCRDRILDSVQQGFDLLGGGVVNSGLVDLHERILTGS